MLAKATRISRFPAIISSPTGTTILEFSLVISIFFLLVIVIVDCSQITTLRSASSDALRRAARRAATQSESSTQAQCLETAQETYNNTLTPFGYDITDHNLSLTVELRSGVSMLKLSVQLPVHCVLCNLVSGGALTDATYYPIETNGACS